MGNPLACECPKRRGPRGQAFFGFECIECHHESTAWVGAQGRICSDCCKREKRCVQCGFLKEKSDG